MPISYKLTEKALEIKETLYKNLRTVTLADTLMPDDYNVPHQIIKQLLEALEQTPKIQDRIIKMGDFVEASHVSDLREICYQLWLYIYQKLQDPYIYEPDFRALKDILDNMRLPKHGDEIKIDEWNSISEFCRKMIDLLCKFAIISYTMQRVDRIYNHINRHYTRPNPQIKDGYLYCAIHDVNAYVVKIDLNNFEEVGIICLKEFDEEEGACISQLEIAGNYLYAGYYRSNFFKVVKIDLSSFKIVDKLTLPSLPAYDWEISLEHYDDYLYATIHTDDTFEIYKINLNNFSITDCLEIIAWHGAFFGYQYDTLAIVLNGHPYMFLAGDLCLYKIDLETFSLAGSICYDEVHYDLMATLSFDGTYLYVGCDNFWGLPRRTPFLKIDPVNMQLVDTLVIEDVNYRSLDMVIIGNYLFNASVGNPARILKINLSSFELEEIINLDYGAEDTFGLVAYNGYLYAITDDYTAIYKLEPYSSRIVDVLRLYQRFEFDSKTRITYDNENIYIPLYSNTGHTLIIDQNTFSLKKPLHMPREVLNYGYPLVSKVLENYIFISIGSYLVKFNRITGEFLGLVDCQKTIAQIIYYDGYLYVVTESTGVYYLHKINPNTMQIECSATLYAWFYTVPCMVAYRNYIIVGSFDQRKYGLLEIFNKENLSRVSWINLRYGDEIRDMTIYGDFLFIALYRSPAEIMRFNIKNIPELPEPTIIRLENGEEYAKRIAVIPPVLMIGLETSPAKIVQVNIYTFTRVDSFTFEQDENEIADICIIGNDLYAVTIDGKIVKIKLG